MNTTVDQMARPHVAEAPPAPPLSSAKQWYLLALLTAAMVISFADRSVLAMLIQPIKAELGLSDAAIGVLTGFAFSAFYAIFGLAMARLSDAGAHRWVIFGSLVSWSIMTALCGVARNFWEMLAARFGVGAGEAGVVPASHAVLATLFPAGLRSTALAILMAGGPLGILIAFAVSAPIEAQIGWRMTFVVLGLPGLILSVVFLFSSSSFVNIGQASPMGVPRPTLIAALRRVVASRAFLHVLLTTVAVNLLTFGQTQWLPAYLERSFALPRTQLGPLLAMTQGIGMLLGMVAGGPLFDWFGARDERWRARLLQICLTAALPFVIAVYSVGDAYLAAYLAGLAAFIFALPAGQLWSAVQDVVSAEQRATGAALVMMASAFLGMGCGPVLIGWLSDLLAPVAGVQSLRYALLLTVTLGGAWMLTHLLLLVRAMRTHVAAIGLN